MTSSVSNTPVTLVRARTIHTLAGSDAEAMLVAWGRVVATGNATDLRGHPGLEQEVELDGVLMPGFNDAHAHPTMTAENLLHVDCSPELAVDEATLVARLRKATETTPRGSWVRGSRYDHLKSTGGRVVDTLCC